MPYTTRWEDEGTRTVFTGIVTDEDLIRCNTDVYDDPRFSTLRYEIGNFLDVTEYSATSDTVRMVAQMDRAAAKKNPNVKVAIIATEAITIGLTRMYEMSAGDTSWEVRIFGDEQSARGWIDGK